MPGENSPSSENKDRELIYTIHEKLGEISIAEYTSLPRKKKKTAKKIREGRMPSQFELSRLAKSLSQKED